MIVFLSNLLIGNLKPIGMEVLDAIRQAEAVSASSRTLLHRLTSIRIEPNSLVPLFYGTSELFHKRMSRKGSDKGGEVKTGGRDSRQGIDSSPSESSNRHLPPRRAVLASLRIPYAGFSGSTMISHLCHEKSECNCPDRTELVAVCLASELITSKCPSSEHDKGDRGSDLYVLDWDHTVEAYL